MSSLATGAAVPLIAAGCICACDGAVPSKTGAAVRDSAGVAITESAHDPSIRSPVTVEHARTLAMPTKSDASMRQGT